MKEISTATYGKEIEFEEIRKEDERKLFSNPDRGFRHQIDFHLKREVPGGGDFYSFAEEVIHANVDYFEGVHPTISQTYIYLTEFREEMILPDAALRQVEMILAAHRPFGLKALLRFCYETEMDGTGEASEEIMISHMSQLFPIVKEYIDVIHVYQAGFLGAWGEWHSNVCPVDKKSLLENIIKYCPEELFIQMRLPSFKNLIPESDPGYKRLSFHNDSVFGEFSLASGGVDPGTEQTKQVERECPYLPVDGELFWGRWSAGSSGFFPDPFKVTKWLYEQRYTSLSAMHNYMETGPSRFYALRLWQNIEITEDFFKDNNIQFDAEYFTERRSVFEYLRDHLGYRLVIKSMTVDKTDTDKISIAIKLVNKGFAAPLLIPYAEIDILDRDFNIISSVNTVSPAGWFNRSPVDLSSQEYIEHRIDEKLTLPDGGKYIGLRLENSAGTPVRLANDICYKNGVNILCGI